MPIPGLSLVGLLDEQAALHHLRFVCMPPDSSDAALRAAWQAAAGQVGAPVPNAGNPGIQPIPQAHATYIDQVRNTPWIANLLNTQWAGAEFKLVEIAPLLAFQQTVNMARSEHHCGKANALPAQDEIYRICLPTALDSVTPQVLPASNAPSPNSLMLKTRSGNLRIAGWGAFQAVNGANVVGIALAVAPSLVHVARYEGRYYLHNGYHRTVGLMRAGATHVPCLVRDLSNPQELGIREDGGTFNLARLKGVNPPTLAHYGNGRAYPVSLRSTARIIHLSWSEYMAPEDDQGA